MRTPKRKAREATRRATAALLLALLVLAPGRANAQWGLPVTDVPNLTLESMQLLWQERIKDDAADKLIELYNQHRRLGNLNWRDAQAYLLLMRAAAEDGNAFGYGDPDIGVLLAQHFPGTTGYATDLIEGKRRQVARHMQTARNQVTTLQMQYEMVRRSRDRMRDYIADLSSIVGEQQAFDLILAMSVLEAEEFTLIRQLLAQDLLMTSVTASDVIGDKALQVHTLAASIGVAVP